MKKRLLCILLALLLLCGCTLGEEDLLGGLLPTPVQTPVETLSLSFNAAQTLDPYAQTTALNLQLAGLMWEPLYELDEKLNCLPVLAGEYEKLSDTAYRVRIADRVFWDGSPVTADDVIFSYAKAVESVNYSHLRGSILSLAKDQNDLIVTLVRPNVYFYGLLNFPVVKAGSYAAADTSGEPAQNAVPAVSYVGTGLYTPAFGAASVTLTRSDRHPSAAAANVKTIVLKDTPDFAAMNAAISSQLSDGGYSDLSGGLQPSVSGNVFGVRQNNLVFLGLVQKGALSDARLRKAVSLALNRTMLNSFYNGYAQTAVTPFHPDFYAADGKSCANLKSDTAAAKALIAELGYAPSLTLVYCSDNAASVKMAEELRRQLEACQISVTLRGLGLSEYRSAVAAGSCDLYLGELKLANDYSFASLLNPDAAALTAPPAEISTDAAVAAEPVSAPAVAAAPTLSSGLSVSCTAALRSALDAFLAGGSVEDFLTLFNEQLPFIPLLYRSGMVAYAKKYDITQTAVFDNAFSGIEKTTVTTYVNAEDE